MDPVVAPVLAAAAALGVYLKFSSSRKGLTDARSVERAWIATFPGDQVRRSVVSKDGRAALVETDWGTGLVCRGGEVARRLDDVETELDEGGLVIRLPEFGTPRIRLKLDASEAADWQERIEST